MNLRNVMFIPDATAPGTFGAKDVKTDRSANKYCDLNQ